MSAVPVIAVLLVCRNRRETTLAALSSLAAQASCATLRVYLFDDASTDGTPEAVASAFPGVVIVPGDGHAFWNGGLHRVWQRALADDPDAYLWLNDDVVLDGDALPRLIEARARMAAQTGSETFILAAATRGPDGAVTYAGFRRRASPFALRFERVDPTGALVPIDTFNGNIVLIGRTVIARIGLNDPAFFHTLGDIDYGLRAQSAGIPMRLLPGTLGLCAANLVRRQRGYGAAGLSLREQWRMVNTHHGLPFRNWWRMTRRHSGKWWPLHFLLPYRALVVPPFLLRRFSRRAAA